MTGRRGAHRARPGGWWARAGLVTAGTLMIGYGSVGAVTGPDTDPVGHLVFLAAVLVAHDGVLMPLVIVGGVAVGRFVPAVVRPAVAGAALVSLALVLVAWPLVAGFGRRADDPSALPGPYGRGLALLLLLVWVGALAGAGIRARRAGPRTQRADPARAAVRTPKQPPPSAGAPGR